MCHWQFKNMSRKICATKIIFKWKVRNIPGFSKMLLKGRFGYSLMFSFKNSQKQLFTKSFYSHGLIILKLQLASSQFVVLPSFSGAVQGSVRDSYQASGP